MTGSVQRETSSALPTEKDAVFRKAVTLHQQRRFAEAETFLQQALIDTPDDPSLWNVRGATLRKMGQYGEAIGCFHRALAVTGDQAAVWSNLGNALTDLMHTESAIACHHRAIDLEPDDSGAHLNLGIALAAADRPIEALAAFDRALALRPDNRRARWERASTHLRLGDYQRGWADYEVRPTPGIRQPPGRPWKGERYEGKRLLIVSERSVADAIWIARFLPRVKAQGGELVMECPPRLIPLMASMKIADRLVAEGGPLPEAEFHLRQCTLPGLVTPNLRSIPSAPYLRADADRVAKFQALTDRGGGKFCVGIAWSESTTSKADHDRTASLQLFSQWFALPGVQLYALQKGSPENELKTLATASPIVDLVPYIDDFADTAAAIARLDLVITVDSAVAHLAGAMGKPVWTLLSYVPHWLWLLERTDSPWYPTMRLIRQRTWNDWTGVFDQAAATLLRLANPTRFA